MADLKISQLSDGGDSQATDEYVIARSGANYRIDGASIAAAATKVGTLSSLTVSGVTNITRSGTALSWSADVSLGITRNGTSGASASLALSAGDTGAGFIYFGNSTTQQKGAIYYDNSNNGMFFQTNGSTKLTLDTSGNLGLGVTPSLDLQVEKSASSGTVDILVKNTATTGTSNSRLMAYVGSASSGDPKMGVGVTGVRDYFWYIDNSDSDIFKLADSGTDILQIIDGSSLALKGASPQTGTGITFPATQSASSNANTLDDYEEGTWTPVLDGYTTPGTYTFSSSYAQYTKVGRVVHLNCYFAIDTASGGAGFARITGLPFTKGANQTYAGAISISGVDLTANTVSLAIVPGSTGATSELYIAQMQDNAASVILDISGISSGDSIVFGITYNV